MPNRSQAVKAVLATLAVGALVTALLAALAMAQAPPRLVRIGAPGIKALNSGGASLIGHLDESSIICQSGEVLPRGISAIRFSIWAFYGAPVQVTAYRGSQLVTQGSRNAEWTGTSVTVPVRPLAHSVSGARVCLAIKPNSEPMEVLGNGTKPQQAAINLATGVSPAHIPPNGARPIGGRLAIEYLAPGQGSWWSRILAVARHVGLGRAYSGTWIALLIAALMAVIAVLAVQLTLRELP